ncbi:MAG: nucleoside hydrolase [Candidatus Izemoplasmatales bacterium]|nr:nucleoside hydrolase [Candidatus Izemoplasmatales bacterium]
MNKRNIILDCDPGHDDAIAIMLAGKSDLINLLGITVVGGNQTLEKTGRNTLNLCQYLDIDVPVCLGSANPLVKILEVCPQIHGESGLDGFDFPDLTIDYHNQNGINFIVETILESKEKVTVVTTGPMTNLALAIRLEPKIMDNIDEVLLMGGSYTNGNVTPAAEFNIYSDPEAAFIVFNSGLPVKMFGLDVTRKVMVYQSVIERMEKLNNKASLLFSKLMKVFNENQYRTFGLEAGPLHDPLPIAYLMDKSVVELSWVHCDIDISRGDSYGRTNCDIFDYMKLPKNTFVATKVDVNKYWDIIEQGIKNYN